MIAALLAASLIGASMTADPVTVAQAHFDHVQSYRATIRASGRSGERTEIHYAYLKPGFVRMDFVSPHHGAVLAYDPGVVAGYGAHLTLVSLAVAIVVTSAGAAIATCLPGMAAAAGGGLVVATGIATMHHLGMAAMQLPGRIEWDRPLVAVSLGAGAAFCCLSLIVLQRRHGARARIAAGALMALGVVTLHFVSKAAVTVVPEPGTLALLGLTAAALTLRRRRRR